MFLRIRAATLYLAAAAAIFPLGSRGQQTTVLLQQQYQTLYDNLEKDFWDPSSSNPSGMPRVRPTTDGPNQTASRPNVPYHGQVDNNLTSPMFWQMAQYTNVMFWQWKLTQSQDIHDKILANWAYVRSNFNDAALSAGTDSHLVNLSDDAAWLMNYLVQVHEVLNDANALADAENLLVNTLKRFRDPNNPYTVDGQLWIPKYGILYDTGGTPYSSSYEAMLADAAIYCYDHDRGNSNVNPSFLDYAKSTYGWINTYLLNPPATLPGGGTNPNGGAQYYFTNLYVSPSNWRGKGFPIAQGGPYDGSPNANNPFGPPRAGNSASYSGGTMAMTVLASRLYADVTPTNSQYLTDIQTIATNYVYTNAFGRNVNGQILLLNDRDPWTDGWWAPYVTHEVLAAHPSLDPGGAWQAAFRNTAFNIMNPNGACSTAHPGYYCGDWSGPECDNGNANCQGGLTTYEQRWQKANGGQGGGQASPLQIMTSATTASMVQAAVPSPTTGVVNRILYNSAGTYTYHASNTSTQAITSIDVQCVGGGGGGGGTPVGASSVVGASGGTGGSGFIRHLAASFDGQQIVIGVGGSGGSGQTDGQPGGASYFGPLNQGFPYAPGGASGHPGVPGQLFTYGNAPGNAFNGDVNVQGGQSPCVSNQFTAVAGSGSGGNAAFGWGLGTNAQATNMQKDGVGGSGYGAGGSGSVAIAGQGATTGASGSAGACVITEYQ